MNGKRAFTLIELMIVVAIIAVIVIIAIPSMVRARMAANETSALASCKSIAEAEEIYKRSDRNGDGILEYSTAMSGNNSLLESTAGSSDLGCIDKALGSAEGQPGVSAGRNGYCFMILTSQGAAAEGGSRTYMINKTSGGTAMVLGFGVSSVPTGYDLSGRSAFLIGQSGSIYMKDRGVTGVQETCYNPDTTWASAQ